MTTDNNIETVIRKTFEDQNIYLFDSKNMSSIIFNYIKQIWFPFYTFVYNLLRIFIYLYLFIYIL